MKFLKSFGYILLIMLTAMCLHVGHRFLDAEYKNSYNDMLLYATVVCVASLMVNNRWD